MKKEDCIFCKLANGDIPTATIFEDDDFRVFLDAGPASRGHALIVPKEHYANLYELPDELAMKAFLLAKKLITKLTPVFKADGYNVIQNNGSAAGQTVFHFHMHLIPRYVGDDAGFGWKEHELDDGTRDEILELVKGIYL
ncbi:MAG: HIT family protein [Lachnospiraceae bacterium]|jgi:histidine triad (HIT) family protein|nr:HIT family protein [Lachnospiraceae bacterium]